MEIEEMKGKLQVMNCWWSINNSDKMAWKKWMVFYFFFNQEMNGAVEQRVDDQNDFEEMNNVRIAKERFKMKVKS
jgi:hypothetical protein